MLLQKLFHFPKRILNIDKKDHVPRRVHALQITVFAVKNTVHHAGGIVKIPVPEILAHRRPFIQKRARLPRKDQILRAVLAFHILPAPAKNILVMRNGDDRRLWKLRKDLSGSRMFPHVLLHINMGKRAIIKIFV
jgi:hypothetical protein